MGFAEAIFYLAINMFLVPKSRDEVPFRQMGFDMD